MTATPTPSDTIIILGTRVLGTSPGPMLRPRLEKALELYQAGLASHFIVSGSQGADEDAPARLHAGFSCVPWRTEKSSWKIAPSTQQNLLYSQELMKSRQWTTAIVVSNVSHIARVEALAAKLGLPVTCGAAPMAGSMGPSSANMQGKEWPSLFSFFYSLIRQSFPAAFQKNYIITTPSFPSSCSSWAKASTEGSINFLRS